jgi:hypothetical protein
LTNMYRFFKARYKGTGFRGYPIGTVAYYGFDEKTSVKAVACVITDEEEKTCAIKRWMDSDIVNNNRIQKEIKDFLIENEAKTIIITESPIGCIHEEGKDYQEGEDCPFCPSWKGKQ